MYLCKEKYFIEFALGSIFEFSPITICTILNETPSIEKTFHKTHKSLDICYKSGFPITHEQVVARIEEMKVGRLTNQDGQFDPNFSNAMDREGLK